MLLLLAAATWLGGAACASTSAGRVKGGEAMKPVAEKGATDETADGDRYALVVGIEQFDDSQLHDLRFARSDARALGDNLDAFDEVEVIDDPAETDREALLARLEKFVARADSSRDTLFVYFSTHGTLARRGNGELRRILVASDTQLDDAAATGLPVDRVTSILEGSRSDRTALVLATCHSGSGKSKLTDELTEALARRKGPAVPSLRSVSEASVVLSAAAFEEPAREVDDLDHDVYTYFLLEALEKGDRDRDGAVTITEAHDYARRRTYDYTDGAQRPTAWSRVLGRNPIVLSGNPDSPGYPLLFSYRRSARNMEVSVDGRTKGELPGGIAVPPGTHRVELHDEETGETLWRGRWRAASGERTEIYDLLESTGPWSTGAFGTTFVPLSGPGRRQFGAAYGAGLRGALRGEPWSWSFVEIEGSHLRGSGTARSADRSLPFHLAGNRVAATAGYTAEIGRFQLVAGGKGGLLWASRTFDTEGYRDSEYVFGWTAGPAVGAGWQPFGVDRRPLHRFRLSTRLEGGVLNASLGKRPFHPFVAGSLGVDFAF